MTKDEKISQILRECQEKEDQIRAEFWAAHGGRPNGYSVVPQDIFKEVRAELKRKWKEIEDEYANS